jgi:TRAP-type C4-dicarboxylate transport system substrate-binding protein
MRASEAIELLKLWTALSPEQQAIALAEAKRLAAEREKKAAAN